MVRLILNDWITGRKGLLFFFFIMTLLLLWGPMTSYGPGSLDIAFRLTLLMPLAILLPSERWKNYVIERSLPIPISHIVLARYCSILGVFLAAAVYAAGFRLVALALSPGGSFTALRQVGIGFVLWPIIFWLFGMFITIAMTMPPVFRYGTRRRILSLFLIFWMMQTLPFRIYAELLMKLNASPYRVLWFIIVAATMILMFAISYWVSMAWFRKREL